MKKIIATGAFTLSALFLVSCNNSGTGETNSDTTTQQKDTVKTPQVTEGGLRDSIQTGATDTTTKKDSVNK